MMWCSRDTEEKCVSVTFYIINYYMWLQPPMYLYIWGNLEEQT